MGDRICVHISPSVVLRVWINRLGSWPFGSAQRRGLGGQGPKGGGHPSRRLGRGSRHGGVQGNGSLHL